MDNAIALAAVPITTALLQVASQIYGKAKASLQDYSINKFQNESRKPVTVENLRNGNTKIGKKEGNMNEKSLRWNMRTIYW